MKRRGARLGEAARATVLARYDLQTICLPRQLDWVIADHGRRAGLRPRAGLQYLPALIRNWRARARIASSTARCVPALTGPLRVCSATFSERASSAGSLIRMVALIGRPAARRRPVTRCNHAGEGVCRLDRQEVQHVQRGVPQEAVDLDLGVAAFEYVEQRAIGLRACRLGRRIGVRVEALVPKSAA